MTRVNCITIEGIESAAKSAIVREVAARLKAAGIQVMAQPPSKKVNPAKSEVQQLISEALSPMTDKNEVMLYLAVRSSEPRIIGKTARSGKVWLAPDGYLSALVERYYGYGGLTDYARANKIADYASGRAKPSLTIVVDTQTAGKQKSSKNRDEAYYERLRAGYLWEAKQRGFPLFFATQPIEGVVDKIWSLLTEKLGITSKASIKPTVILPKKSTKSSSGTKAPRYIVPGGLPKKVDSDYRRTLNKVLGLRSEIVNKLQGSAGKTADMVLPLACYCPNGIEENNSKLAAIVGDLDDNYGEPARASLVDFWPRNELNLLPDALYSYSSLPINQLAERIDRWSYDKKAKALQEYYGSQPNSLSGINYTWEVVTSYRSLLDLEGYSVKLDCQLPTPRYGYDVPEEVERAGLAEQFIGCFDASLALYSRLQAAGKKSEASYAALLGHKTRAKLTLTAGELINLRMRTKKQSELRRLLDSLIAPVAEAHPLLASQLRVNKNQNLS